MSTPTHIVIGLVLGKLASSYGFVPQTSFLLPMSVLAANLPDVDAFVIRFPKDHRTSPVHVPFYWFVAWCSAISLLYLTSNQHLLPYAVLIGINILIHFILDSFNIRTGIYWLKPFKAIDCNFFKRVHHAPTVLGMAMQYVKHPLLYIELSIIALGVWYITR